MPSLRQIPSNLRVAEDYEFLAARIIAAPSLAYIAGGSAHDATLAKNRAAFARRAIVPRGLPDVGAGHTRCRVLNENWARPFALAPLAYQNLAHPQGELDTARGAAAAGVTMVVSSLASQRLEVIAAAREARGSTQGAPLWFQLYLQPTQAATVDLLRRAEAAGYQAIVLTLDAAVQLPSYRAQQAGFVMPPNCVPVNLEGYAYPEEVKNGIFERAQQNRVTRESLRWLLAESRLPVWVKGVLAADEAAELKALGVAGVVVSNHGGRSLDGAPASLTVLPAIRAAVGEAFPVLLDSGVRSGSDIFKAVACGADAVLIGRLQVYALAVAGALGVAHMLKLLGEELEACMAMAGCATLADVRRATLIIEE